MDSKAAFQTVIPARPAFGGEDQTRAERNLLAYRMLTHKFAEDAAEFFIEAYGKENAAAMGIPDTTLAPLPAQTAQLTTPGLYPTRPHVGHPRAGDEDVDRVVNTETGALTRARYFSRMNAVMYKTVGVGNWIQRVHIRGEGAAAYPTLQPAYPWDVRVMCSEEDPMEVLTLWWLRLRSRDLGNGRKDWGWYWDVYDISDPEAPTFTIRNALDDGDDHDYTAEFLGGPVAWDWAADDGTPFLPFVFHHAEDAGTFWTEYRPALLHGTLRAVANWTLTGQAALWGQGNHNVIGGVDPDALNVSTLQPDGRISDRPVHTLRNTPGTVTFVPVEQDKQLQLVTMTTGVDLARLVDFSNTYAMNLAITDGISPSDATRRSANPTSGAALTISQADKRAFAARVTPVFTASDLRAIWVIAQMMTRATGLPHAAEGYTISYPPVPLTPTEQAEVRANLEWEIEHGQKSRTAVYKALHPGASDELAFESVVRAAVEEAEIDAEIARRLAAIGALPPETTDDAASDDEEIPVTDSEEETSDDAPDPGMED